MQFQARLLCRTHDETSKLSDYWYVWFTEYITYAVLREFEITNSVCIYLAFRLTCTDYM